MSERKILNIKNFNGGLNTAQLPGLIGDNELTDCDNVILNDNGIVEKFPGLDYISGLGGKPIINSFVYNKDKDDKIILMTDGQKIFKTVDMIAITQIYDYGVAVNIPQFIRG